MSLLSMAVSKDGAKYCKLKWKKNREEKGGGGGRRGRERETDRERERESERDKERGGERECFNREGRHNKDNSKSLCLSLLKDLLTLINQREAVS